MYVSFFDGVPDNLGLIIVKIMIPLIPVDAAFFNA